jgi:hypothetical protein
MLVSFVERSILALRALSAVIAFPLLKSFRVLEQLAAFANAFRDAPNILTFVCAHFHPKTVSHFLECGFPNSAFYPKTVSYFLECSFPNSAFYPKTVSHFLECAVSHLHFASPFLNIHNETRFS